VQELVPRLVSGDIGKRKSRHISRNISDIYRDFFVALLHNARYEELPAKRKVFIDGLASYDPDYHFKDELYNLAVNEENKSSTTVVKVLGRVVETSPEKAPTIYDELTERMEPGAPVPPYLSDLLSKTKPIEN